MNLEQTSNSLHLTRLVRVGCDLEYRLENRAPIMFALQPRDTPRQHVLEQRRFITPTPALGNFKSYSDNYGNVIWRTIADAARRA